MENLDNIETEALPVDEQISVHSELDEKELLNSLGEDFNPDTVIDKKSQKEMLLEQGAMSATAVLGVGEQMLKQFGHKQFAFDEAQVENVAKAAAPLFVKYNGELPPWLAQYKEEIMFTFAAGALGFGSYSQIKALKKIDKEKEVKPTEPEVENSQSESISNATD
ncbi:hypothetical protein [Moritella sp.]|uniref:hypothetical protein n=1 Tax=Moritella sp. TaxID=78556 RepID=UPI001DA04256|nr:hypothetical protein [Moritella sp.]MCJ8350738.1 hypothetical protein [Moritella sp.]NQZ42652.1 hypothetical protein [Moritella sp.]